jgi:hypothetical protein
MRLANKRGSLSFTIGQSVHNAPLRRKGGIATRTQDFEARAEPGPRPSLHAPGHVRSRADST